MEGHKAGGRAAERGSEEAIQERVALGVGRVECGVSWSFRKAATGFVRRGCC